MTRWQAPRAQIRATRAEPPGLISSGSKSREKARRRVYVAAIEQYEQLMHASESVAASAQPLPLFYALSQATRALAAAHLENYHVAGHGMESTAGDGTDPILHRTISRQRTRKRANGFTALCQSYGWPTPPEPPPTESRDAFSQLCRAIGSPGTLRHAELGALWAALPDVPPFPQDAWLPDWRPSLRVSVNIEQLSPPTPSRLDQYRLQAWTFDGNTASPAINNFERDRYPMMPKDALPLGDDVSYSGNWIRLFTWPPGNDIRRLVTGDVDEPHHWLPTLSGSEEVELELALWWALLFGLSVVARYHPERWAKALAPESDRAVPIEELLSVALERLPTLILGALRRGPEPRWDQPL